MSSYNLLNIGNQALRTHKSALTTVGQNITNVNTPGYSRQTTDINSLSDRTGAQAESVSRITDRFLTKQVWSDLSVYQHTLAYSGLSSDLDDLLATQVTSVSNGLDNFFSAMQNVVDDPVSIPNRELLVAETDALVKRFNGLDRHLAQQSETINLRVDDLTKQVNSMTRGIADLNDAIRLAHANRDPANELRDQREELVNNLSNVVGINVVEQGEAFDIFIGNGQPLVTGQTANRLVASPGNPDHRQSDLHLVVANSQLNVTPELQGGQLGGLLEYRAEALNDARDELGRIAIGVAASINEAHKKGIDLNNDLGKNIFTDVNASDVQRSRIQTDANNHSTIAHMHVEIQDVSQLKASDYELFYEDDRQITLIRKSDGQHFTVNQLDASPQTIQADPLNWNGNVAPTTLVQSDTLTPQLNGVPGTSQVINSAQGMAELINSQPGMSGIKAESAINFSIDDNLDNGANFDIQVNDAKGIAQTVNVTVPAGDTKNNAAVLNAINAALAAQTNVSGTDFSNIKLSEAHGGIKLLDHTGGNITLDASGSASSVDDQFTVKNYAANGSLIPGALDVQKGGANPTGTVVGYLTHQQANADSSVTSLSITSSGGLTGNASVDLVTAANNVTALTNNPAEAIAGLQQGEYYLDPAQGTLAFAIDGFKTVIEARQRLVPGDRFLIQPVRTGAEDLGVELKDGKQLALASPIRITTDNANQGTGTATAQVTEAHNLGDTPLKQLSPPIDIVFNQANPATYNVYDMTDPDNPALLQVGDYVPGKAIPLKGYAVTIKNTPEPGDRFSFTFNKDGVSDNRNAIGLSDLQLADVFSDGAYQDLYGSLVERVGTRTATASITVDANKSVLTATTNAKAGVAGVNLDEEAAKLVQFQMAYQASTQIISTSQTIFDSLLNSL